VGLMRSALLWGSRNKWLEDQFRRRRFAQRAVQRFMPGEDAEAALTAAEALKARGMPTILTELGENLTDLQAAGGVTRDYLALLERISQRKLDTQVSIKLTQLGLDLNRDAALENLLTIVGRAGEYGNFVWVDMEDSSYVDVTLELFRKARAERPNLGLCLQSYLYRTAADLESLIPLQPAIRLVKGAYNEPPSVAYPKKADVDSQYLSLAMRLLKGDARQGTPPLGFGTHDVRLIGLIRQHAEAIGLAQDGFEAQMLYGIRREEQERLVRSGMQVRVLISFGAAWFPWYMRRLAERPANVWFVMKTMLQ